MPRTRQKPVPTLHMVMIRVACAICLAGTVGYAVAPNDRKDFFRDLAGSSVIFLFGKFTNGFKMPQSKESAPDASDDDTEAA